MNTSTIVLDQKEYLKGLIMSYQEFIRSKEKQGKRRETRRNTEKQGEIRKNKEKQGKTRKNKKK